jgi:hypothetical protein
LPLAVISPAASITDTKLIVTGGLTLGGGASPAIQIMDLSASDMKWSTPFLLRNARFRHAQITLLDGRILIIGGSGREIGNRSAALASCELITADLTQSQPAAPLPTSMACPTAHLLPDGRGLAIGDSLAAIYDPQLNTWTAAIALHDFRREHASLLLPDGGVLVLGGIGKSSLERIDPTLGVTSLLPVRFKAPLDDMAATLLPDGRIWVLAGQIPGGNTTDQTWLINLSARTIIPGPSLNVPGGVADHKLLATPRGLILVGGESQLNDHDTELGLSLWLDPVSLSVHRLTDTDLAHDDAAAVTYRDTVIVVGGEVTGSFWGIPMPTPVRAVHQLCWPDGER